MEGKIISDGEVAVIRAALTVTEGIVKRSDHMGRAAEAFDAAARGLFHALNIANSYYDANLSYEQLHGRPEIVA